MVKKVINLFKNVSILDKNQDKESIKMDESNIIEECLICFKEMNEGDLIPKIFHNNQPQHVIYVSKENRFNIDALLSITCALVNTNSGGLILIGARGINDSC